MLFRNALWSIFDHVVEGHRDEFNHTLFSEVAHIVGVLRLFLCEHENGFVQHGVKRVVIELAHWHSLNIIFVFLNLVFIEELWVGVELDIPLQRALHGCWMATFERLFVLIDPFLRFNLLLGIEFDFRPELSIAIVLIMFEVD